MTVCKLKKMVSVWTSFLELTKISFYLIRGPIFFPSEFSVVVVLEPSMAALYACLELTNFIKDWLQFVFSPLFRDFSGRLLLGET